MYRFAKPAWLIDCFMELHVNLHSCSEIIRECKQNLFGILLLLQMEVVVVMNLAPRQFQHIKIASATLCQTIPVLSV